MIRVEHAINLNIALSQKPIDTLDIKFNCLK